MREDGRRTDELRPLELKVDFLDNPQGSALISVGKTRVLCTASIEEGVPRWLKGSGRGWMTAEYGLLPASTGERTSREASSGSEAEVAALQATRISLTPCASRYEAISSEKRLNSSRGRGP